MDKRLMVQKQNFTGDKFSTACNFDHRADLAYGWAVRTDVTSQQNF